MTPNVSREASFKMPWLPRDVRALKRLRLRELTADEIAEVLGRTPQSVRLKIHRVKEIEKRRYRKPVHKPARLVALAMVGEGKQ